MRAALLPLTILILASGCTQLADHSPPGASIEEPECPLVAQPQEGTIPTEFGEYNASNGASSSYDDFEWDWPSGSRIAMNVVAEWDSGALGEKSMQLRVALRSRYLDSMGLAYGSSPLMLNFTTTVPDKGDLAVIMEPRGAAVNKEAFESHVTMVQTLLCKP